MAEVVRKLTRLSDALATLSEAPPAGSRSRSRLLALQRIRIVCDRFHLVARALSESRHAKTRFVVKDEYDVQAVLHALLVVDFDDVRIEHWTPSYAGGSARVDFLLPRYQILVEAKLAGRKLRDADIGKQLIVDVARYKADSRSRNLFCLVYDPMSCIRNPLGLETDLAKLSTRTFQVEVAVRPRGT